jgi:hypothetical protein
VDARAWNYLPVLLLLADPVQEEEREEESAGVSE